MSVTPDALAKMTREELVAWSTALNELSRLYCFEKIRRDAIEKNDDVQKVNAEGLIEKWVVRVPMLIRAAEDEIPF